ncbi:MAG: hypothetical protein Q9215_007742 [Flavoplaca cf. flavocitrina]
MAMKSCLRISSTFPKSFRLSLTLRRTIATHAYSHHAKQLSILPTNVDSSSPTFRDNATNFNALMSRMEDLHRKIERGGTEKAREKHLAKGKMLVRDVKGGTYYPITVKKHLRAQAIAEENRK